MWHYCHIPYKMKNYLIACMVHHLSKRMPTVRVNLCKQVAGDGFWHNIRMARLAATIRKLSKG